MQTVNLKISELKPYKKNAKKHDEKQVKNIAESIKQFGFVQPVVVDKDNEIIIGHGRVEAAKRLNIEEIPCVKMESLTQEQVKKLRIVDNKLNESDWDLDLLKEDIEDLSFDGFDIDFELSETEIDWDSIDEISEKNYEKPESEKLRCPLCNGIDEKIRFKKV